MMTMRKRLSRILVSLLLLVALTTSTGCIEELVLGGTGLFGAGFVAGRATTPTTTTTQCYRNGELIDCSELQE